MPDAGGGVLWLVPTPIGNLGDMTLRAVEVLRQADAVLAEDTRRTRALLSHLAIGDATLERFDSVAERRKVDAVVERLLSGAKLALVSDAGMPTISDPGAELVARAAAAGVRVEALPGPSAVTAAIAASGFGGGRFRFFGFLPRKGRERREAIEAIVASEEMCVLFESPGRLAACLADLAEVQPERQAVVARELTKLHEELLRGTLAELATLERNDRGEITLVLGPHQPEAASLSEEQLDARIAELRAAGKRAKDIARLLSIDSGWTTRDIYQRVIDEDRP